MNESEPLMKCRENEPSVKTAIKLCSQEDHNGYLIYWLWGRRHLGGMISIWAYLWNRGDQAKL